MLASPGTAGGLFAHELGTLAYGLVAVLTWRAYQRSVRGGMAWVLCFIAFVALAINQQCSLLEALVDLIRGVSRAQSWYRERRPVQREIILGLAAAGAGGMILLLAMLRREAWQLRLVALVAAGLLVFALIRAVSLHSVDALFGRRLWPPLPLTRGNLIELGGLVIAALACLSVRRPRGRRRHRPRPSARRADHG